MSAAEQPSFTGGADALPEDLLALLSTLLRVAPSQAGKAQRKRLTELILTSLSNPNLS